MFRGLHDTTIDSKGRTSMPVRFREVLAQQDLAAALEEAEARIDAEAEGAGEPEEGSEPEGDVEVVELEYGGSSNGKGSRRSN